jgi:hypothetical protein
MKRTRFLLVLDTILLVAIILLIEPRFTDLPIHEWLGIAAIPLILLHLLLGWGWIVATARRLAVKGAWRSKINALLNTALFVSFVITVFSGIMTSFIALPSLGIPARNFESWQVLHNQWSVYLQVLAGLHVALNWGWIVGAVKRHVLARPTQRSEAALGALEAAES